MTTAPIKQGTPDTSKDGEGGCTETIRSPYRRGERCGNVVVRDGLCFSHLPRNPQPASVKCACKCGELAAPGKRFRQGHWARTRTVAQAEPCLCGCGKRPRKATSRYCWGHRQRMPGASKPPSTPAERVQSTCAICRKTFTRRVNYGRGLYCGRLCQAKGAETAPRPKLLLGKFLYDEYRSFGGTRAAFAQNIGIGRRTLGRLMADQGRHLPTADVYKRLRSRFGEALPASKTETARRSQMGREQGKQHLPLAMTPDARKKAADSLRGQKHSPERVANMVAGMKEGHYDKLAEAARRYSRSPQGRAVRSLTGRLRGSPSPTKPVLKSWAGEVGERIGMPAESVSIIWNKYMRDHGIATTKRGRKAHEERHRLVVELWSSTPKRAAARPRGASGARPPNTKERRAATPSRTGLSGIAQGAQPPNSMIGGMAQSGQLRCINSSSLTT